MQNCYVGDVGDFGKYGLLRWLTGMTGMTGTAPARKLRLGVVWYLYHDNVGGGGLTDYLNPTPENIARFQECDACLYDTLAGLVLVDNNNQRNIIAVQQSGLLPGDTSYYENCRCGFANRGDWLNSALLATQTSELVFLDPDNGIAEIAEAPPVDSPKHVYMDDLIPFVERGQSLVIYHHLTRHHGIAEQEIGHFAQRLIDEIPIANLNVRALWYHRNQARVYFIVTQPCHKDVIEQRLNGFHGSSWCADADPNFTYYPAPFNLA